MKILKLLNKKNLSIIIISLLLPLFSTAEEKPVDIWNIDKQETETISEENLSQETLKKNFKVIFIKCKLIKIRTL